MRCERISVFCGFQKLLDHIKRNSKLFLVRNIRRKKKIFGSNWRHWGEKQLFLSLPPSQSLAENVCMCVYDETVKRSSLLRLPPGTRFNLVCLLLFFLFFRFVTCVSEGAECRTFGPITKLYKYESGPRSDAVVNKQKSSRILLSCLSTLGEIFISV